MLGSSSTLGGGAVTPKPTSARHKPDDLEVWLKCVDALVADDYRDAKDPTLADSLVTCLVNIARAGNDDAFARATDKVAALYVHSTPWIQSIFIESLRLQCDLLVIVFFCHRVSLLHSAVSVPRHLLLVTPYWEFPPANVTSSYMMGFGPNTSYNIGIPSSLEIVEPRLIAWPEKVRIVTVSMSNTHTLFLTDRGEVYGCGQGGQGQLGIGNEGIIASPVHIRIPMTAAGITPKITDIAACELHSVFISDKAVFCCGRNNSNCLGSVRTDADLPLQVQFESKDLLEIICGPQLTMVFTRRSSVAISGRIGDRTITAFTLFNLSFRTVPTIADGKMVTVGGLMPVFDHTAASLQATSQIWWDEEQFDAAIAKPHYTLEMIREVRELCKTTILFPTPNDPNTIIKLSMFLHAAEGVPIPTAQFIYFRFQELTTAQPVRCHISINGLLTALNVLQFHCSPKGIVTVLAAPLKGTRQCDYSIYRGRASLIENSQTVDGVGFEFVQQHHGVQYTADRFSVIIELQEISGTHNVRSFAASADGLSVIYMVESVRKRVEALELADINANCETAYQSTYKNNSIEALNEAAEKFAMCPFENDVKVVMSSYEDGTSLGGGPPRGSAVFNKKPQISEYLSPEIMIAEDHRREFNKELELHYLGHFTDALRKGVLNLHMKQLEMELPRAALSVWLPSALPYIKDGVLDIPQFVSAFFGPEAVYVVAEIVFMYLRGKNTLDRKYLDLLLLGTNCYLDNPINLPELLSRIGIIIWQECHDRWRFCHQHSSDIPSGVADCVLKSSDGHKIPFMRDQLALHSPYFGLAMQYRSDDDMPVFEVDAPTRAVESVLQAITDPKSVLQLSAPKVIEFVQFCDQYMMTTVMETCLDFLFDNVNEFTVSTLFELFAVLDEHLVEEISSRFIGKEDLICHWRSSNAAPLQLIRQFVQWHTPELDFQSVESENLMMIGGCYVTQRLSQVDPSMQIPFPFSWAHFSQNQVEQRLLGGFGKAIEGGEKEFRYHFEKARRDISDHLSDEEFDGESMYSTYYPNTRRDDDSTWPTILRALKHRCSVEVNAEETTSKKPSQRQRRKSHRVSDKERRDSEKASIGSMLNSPPALKEIRTLSEEIADVSYYQLIEEPHDTPKVEDPITVWKTGPQIETVSPRNLSGSMFPTLDLSTSLDKDHGVHIEQGHAISNGSAKKFGKTPKGTRFRKLDAVVKNVGPETHFAPWMKPSGSASPVGPSLTEIQEAESRQTVHNPPPRKQPVVPVKKHWDVGVSAPVPICVPQGQMMSCPTRFASPQSPRLSDIIAEEKRRADRAKTREWRPFHLHEIEERAIAEIKQLYLESAGQENVIVVERVVDTQEAPSWGHGMMRSG